MLATILCITAAFWLIPLATVLLKRVTGVSGGPTLNEITTGVAAGPYTLNTFDAAFDGTAHPVQVPAAGSNYSYWASICAVCSVAPVAGINNMAIYSDGSSGLGTGIGCNVSTVAGTNGSITTNYTQATGNPGVTGLEMGSNYGHSITAPANFFGFTAASPLSLAGSFATGTDTAANSAAGRFGDWLIQQLTVGTTGVTGTTPAETLTLVWDEF